MCQMMSQQGRRPTYLNREFCLELRDKKRIYGLWKKEQAAQDNNKDVVSLRRKRIRKA